MADQMQVVTTTVNKTFKVGSTAVNCIAGQRILMRRHSAGATIEIIDIECPAGKTRVVRTTLEIEEA